MDVIIRKIENKENEFFAYTKSLCGKATYFVYFSDGIWGAVTLHNFIEMLRGFFQPSEVHIMVDEKDITLKNDTFLELLKD